MSTCFLHPFSIGRLSTNESNKTKCSNLFKASVTPESKQNDNGLPRISRRSILGTAAGVALSALLPESKNIARSEPIEIDYLYDALSGSFVPPSRLDGLFRRDAGSLFDRYIVAAEVHNNKRTHDVQLAVIDSARRIRDNRQLIVGFEQFYPSHNVHLDAYVYGDISLTDMLQRTDWDNTWGFDADLYTPIFEYCKKHHILMRGLNIPFGVASQVGRVGLDGLPDRIKKHLPEMDFSNKQHYDHFVRLVSQSHFLGEGDEAKLTLQRYYQVQVLWEEWMSHAAASFIQKNPEARFVFAIGSGHVERRFGFPDRLQKRVNERPYTVVPKPVSWVFEDGYITPDISRPEVGIADVVWYTREI